MKLYEFSYLYDFGHEVYLNLVCNRSWNLLELNANFDEYGSYSIGISLWSRPTAVLALSIGFWRFRGSITVISLYPTRLPPSYLD